MSGNRSTRGLESFLEVISSDHWDWVLNSLHISIVSVFTILSSQSSALFLSGDTFSNGSLGGPLAQFCDIGTSEVLGQLSTELECNVGGDGTLSEVGLEDVDSGTLIRQWDIDELIETTRSDKSFIKNVWSVCSTDEEQILFRTCTVHFSQKLVKHSITSATTTST